MMLVASTIDFLLPSGQSRLKQAETKFKQSPPFAWILLLFVQIQTQIQRQVKIQIQIQLKKVTAPAYLTDSQATAPPPGCPRL